MRRRTATITLFGRRKTRRRWLRENGNAVEHEPPKRSSVANRDNLLMPVRSTPTHSGPKKVAIIVDVDTVRSACRLLETTVIEALRQLKFTAVGLGTLTIARAFSSNPWKYAKRFHEL